MSLHKLTKPKYEILGSHWYTPLMPVSLISGIHYCIGVVAIKSGEFEDGIFQWKAYIGYGVGISEDSDEQIVAAHGMPLGQDVAAAYFPELSYIGWRA